MMFLAGRAGNLPEADLAPAGLRQGSSWAVRKVARISEGR